MCWLVSQASPGGQPVLSQVVVAAVQVGPGYRRTVFEKGGNEVVGGVVVMRHGENPLAVTERVRQKIQELQPGLPEQPQLAATVNGSASSRTPTRYGCRTLPRTRATT